MADVEREILAQTEDMRFTLYTLAPGAGLPWHFHSEVSDWYLGREGMLAVETRSPAEIARLAPGEMFNVPTGRAHRVFNLGNGVCRFALVQGIGAYDFNLITNQD